MVISEYLDLVQKLKPFIQSTIGGTTTGASILGQPFFEPGLVMVQIVFCWQPFKKVASR